MTDQEKVKIYESFLHNLDMLLLVGNSNSNKIKEKLDLIRKWSYAHRQGNGENTPEEQESLINSALEKLK